MDRVKNNPTVQFNIKNILQQQEQNISEIQNKNSFNDVLYSFSYNTELLIKQNLFITAKMIYTQIMITDDVQFQQSVQDIINNKHIQHMLPLIKQKSMQLFLYLSTKIKAKIKYISYNTLMKIGYFCNLILRDVFHLEFHNIMLEIMNTIQLPLQIKAFLNGFFYDVKDIIQVGNKINPEQERQFQQLDDIKFLFYVYIMLKYTTYQFTSEHIIAQINQALSLFYNQQLSTDLQNISMVIYIVCKLKHIDVIRKHMVPYQKKFILHEYHKKACQTSVETMYSLVDYYQDEQIIVEQLSYIVIGNMLFSFFIQHLKNQPKSVQHKLANINYFKHTNIVAGILKDYKYLSMSEYKHQLIDQIQIIAKHYFQKYQSQIEDIINQLDFQDIIISLIVIGIVNHVKVENPFETFIQIYFQNNYNTVNYQVMLKCTCYNQYSGDLTEVLENWDNIKMINNNNLIKYNDIDSNEVSTSKNSIKAMTILFCIMCRSNNNVIFNNVKGLLESFNSLSLKMLSTIIYQMLRIKYFDNFDHQYQQQLIEIIQFGIQRLQQLTTIGGGYSRFILTIIQLYNINFQSIIQKFSNKYFINIQYDCLDIESIIRHLDQIQTVYGTNQQILQYIQILTQLNYYNIDAPYRVYNQIYNLIYTSLLSAFQSMFRDNEYLGILNNYLNNLLIIIKLGQNPMDYVFIMAMQQLNQLVELCTMQKYKFSIRQPLNFTQLSLLFDHGNSKITYENPEKYKKSILQLRYNDHQLKQIKDFDKIISHCLQQSLLDRKSYYFITKYIFVRMFDKCYANLSIKFSNIYESLLTLKECQNLSKTSDIAAAQICYLIHTDPEYLMDNISLLLLNSFYNNLLHDLILNLTNISDYNQIIINSITNVLYQQATQTSLINKQDVKHIVILLGMLNQIFSKKQQYILQQLHENQQSQKQNIYQQLVKISESLIDIPDLERQERLEQMLDDMKIDNKVPLLLDNHQYIEKINVKTCRTLKSHAKVPLLIQVSTQRGEAVKFIIKSRDAVFQDHCVLLMLQQHFQRFMDRLTFYRVVPLSHDSGFLELVPLSSSLDEVGDRSEAFLSAYFDECLTEVHKRNYVESLAQYSCCSHFLRFKDRHNGNILLLENGQLAHIDFGFFFDTAPGGAFSVETAPFKLAKADIRLCGGMDGAFFHYFRAEFRKALLLSRIMAYELLSSLQLFLKKIPGVKRQQTIDATKEKFMDGLDGPEIVQAAESLIQTSVNSVGTGMYDKFQARQNGINH